MKGRHALILSFLIMIFLLLALLIIDNSEYHNLLLGALVGLAISSSMQVGGWMLCNRNRLVTILCAIGVRNLRISCSYLYRIKVDDHYLLIRSRKHRKFQPVGGNFKRNKFSHETLQKLEVKTDDKFTNGNRSADDLRLYIRGYRLTDFLKWYNSPNKKREVSYDREFYEELVEPGHFSSESFKYPVIDFVKQVITPVRYSKYLKCYEVHIYDIVELMPHHEQSKYLRELKNKGDGAEFKWATDTTIRNQGYEASQLMAPYPITDHSIEILT